MNSPVLSFSLLEFVLLLVLFSGWTFLVSIVALFLGATLMHRKDLYQPPLPDFFGALQGMTQMVTGGKTEPEQKPRQPVRDGL